MLRDTEIWQIVFVTASTKEEADRIADALIRNRLAACVQVLPGMESVFWWKDEIQRENEHLLLIKSAARCFDELEKTVRESHSYDTPEIVSIDLSAISKPYRDWLSTNLRTSTDKPEPNN